VRRLEESGVIAGYAALVPPHKIGLGLSAFIEVQLHRPVDARAARLIEPFRQAVRQWPEVAECVCLSSEMSFLLRVLVADMAHYTRFMTDTLLQHPGVRDCKTSFVLEQVKSARPMPA
jgi:Lrp/AsnC family leucine-responsive transcriptional regulator